MESAPKSLFSDNGPIRLKRFERQDLKKDFSSINWHPSGRVCDVVGTVIEAALPGATLGTIVNIAVRNQPDVIAEVVGFKDDRSLLLPYSSIAGIAPGASVSGKRTVDKILVGDFLLGRVLDPMMKPLIGEPIEIPDYATHTPLFNQAWVPIEKDAPNPMTRSRIEKPLSLGIRAIDGLLTFGEGQRIGIMAGSGVGKSVLLGMIARGSAADINVIGLIGERGREVREFLERDLGPEGLARSVVVCVTGDQSPLMRIRAAKVVTSIAEYFSSRGKNVLMMMDSLTRVAMAQREIGLAVGEPPTTKGYPPSTFSLLPRLLERCGPQGPSEGCISGIYTVLVDGDDFNDPIPDAARSILDGHIQLSRSLAARGHFPAIDVGGSVSRVMHDIIDEDHWGLSQTFKTLMGTYQENFDYVQIGSYQSGTNPTLDVALQLMPQIEGFLKQGINELSTIGEAKEAIKRIFRAKNPNAKEFQ